MKYLLFFILITSCAHNKYDSQDTLHLLITEHGSSQEVSVPIKFTDGLFLFFSDKIDGGGKPFSYTSSREIEIKILNTNLEDLILFSSFPQDYSKLKKAKLSKFVIGLAERKNWKVHSFESQTTKFSLITKKSSTLDTVHWKKSITDIWDYYRSKFNQSVPQVTFIELNWAPISGGPLGENVLAIFSQDLISIQGQNEIRNDLGWLAQNSTHDYIKANYPNSPDPWRDYLVGAYAHELGHIFFGFGKTREEVQAPHELWFSLGMGMLYGGDITKRITGNTPAIFQATESTYEKHSKIKGLDQRLVNPDTSQDKYYKLDRKKVYAHSKSLKFLKALRTVVGEAQFDEAAKKYIQECGACIKGYEDFRKFLTIDNSKIKKIEQLFQVY